MKLIGLGDDESTVTLARMAGVRDFALGVHALSVRNDATKLREASLLAVLVDAGDAAAFGARIPRKGVDQAVLMNLPVAAVAVLAGAWVSSRLRP